MVATSMISLFGDAPKATSNWLPFVLKTLAINVAAAIACALLACLYFAVGFATEESGQPTPMRAFVVLGMIVLAVAILGAVLAAITQHFPWLAAVLTPLFFWASDRRDGLWSLEFGAMASGVFLLGALTTLGVKHCIRTRKHSNPPGTALV